ncbi:EamA family transporter RarD [Micrococcales bacterium 31B]|nr:EamA family transporter RarD [Micrococcales bacterium 31B]
MWGAFPLLFHALAPASALEIVAHRIVWCLLFCLVVVTLMGLSGRGPGALRRFALGGRVWANLALASVFVCANWLIYVVAVSRDNVLEASLGYFINPLFTVALGIVVLRERMTALQGVALALGAGAVLVIVLGYGRVPWYALGLAISFALYSLMKKRVGGRVDAMTGLTVESLVLLPFALSYLGYLGVRGESTFVGHGSGHLALLVISGVATALPLLSFAAAASRVSLTIIGLSQYITPVMQFLLGLLYFQEPMPLTRLVGFSLVWLGIMVLTYDSIRAWRKIQQRRAAESEVSATEPV